MNRSALVPVLLACFAGVMTGRHVAIGASKRATEEVTARAEALEKRLSALDDQVSGVSMRMPALPRPARVPVSVPRPAPVQPSGPLPIEVGSSRVRLAYWRTENRYERYAYVSWEALIINRGEFAVRTDESVLFYLAAFGTEPRVRIDLPERNMLIQPGCTKLVRGIVAVRDPRAKDYGIVKVATNDWHVKQVEEQLREYEAQLAKSR